MKTKAILTWIAAGLVTILSLAFILPDRIIQAFLPWRDIPGWHEVNSMDHEKDRLATRVALYIVIAAFIVLLQWITGIPSAIWNFFF